MRAYLRINDQIGFETSDCSTLQDTIKEVTYLRKVVGYEPCGKCKSDNIIPQHREVTKDGDTNEYYELLCLSCGAVLALGQNKEGKTLYKKKLETNSKGKAVKDGDKAKYLPDNGWSKYNKETGQKE